MRWPHWVLYCSLAAGVAALAGCSGSGATADDIRGGNLQTLAEDSLNVLALYKSWDDFLYAPLAQQSETPKITHGDGFINIHGRNSDGSIYDWYILTSAGNGGYGTVTYPDGRVWRQTCDPRVWEGSTCYDHVLNTYPDGATLEVFTSCDITSEPFTSYSHGTATALNGKQLRFELRRRDMLDDTLALILDGVKFELTVPTNAQMTFRPFCPNFVAGANGTLKTAHSLLKFRLSGQDQRWDKLETETTDGTKGGFTLEADWHGNGQFERGGSTVASLRWSELIVGMLDLLGAGQKEINPSAAVRDLEIGRWVTNSSALGPMPIY